MQNQWDGFWTIYEKLEKDVVSLSYYIHFSDDVIKDKNGQVRNCQLWTYSNQIADLLIAISVQIESLILELYKEVFKLSPSSIGAALNALEEKWKLSSKQIMIISRRMFFVDPRGLGKEWAPMSYKNGDDNDYYSSYCAVKHDRMHTLHKANINTLVRALGALFIFYNVHAVTFDSSFSTLCIINCFIAQHCIHVKGCTH